MIAPFFKFNFNICCRKYFSFEGRIFTLDDNKVIDTFKFSFSSVYKLEDFEIDQKIKFLKKRNNMKEFILPKYSIKS